MAIISRIKTWVAEVLTPSDLNGEFNNIINFINNVDGATTTWTNVKATTLNSTVSTILKGSATNDSAATGNIGEYISAFNTGVNATGNGQWFDVTALNSPSLTAGDWDITAHISFNLAGATMTKCSGGVSTTSGNSSTGLVSGDNWMQTLPGNSSTDTGVTISAWRLSIATTTIVYLKANMAFSAGTPIAYGRISARRVR